MCVCVYGGSGGEVEEEYSATQTGNLSGNVERYLLLFECSVEPLTQLGEVGVGQIAIVSLNASRRVCNL